MYAFSVSECQRIKIVFNRLCAQTAKTGLNCEKMSSLYQIDKLDGDNYDTWVIQMRSVLIHNGQWKIVSGAVKEGDAADKPAFLTEDEKALATICLCVKPSQLGCSCGYAAGTNLHPFAILIQENTGGQNWYHVRSEDNPADLGSRGVSPAELAVSSLWWHGPEWLCSDSSQWDINDFTPLETDVEVRAVRTHASFFTNYEDILERFSSLDRALRVIAYIFRFYHRTHYSHASRNVYHGTTLTATELKAVRLRLAVLSQRAHYPDEYYCLREKKPLGSRSSLLSLNPFLDEEGVMRLNGRLSRCPTLSYSERHPIIVPYNSRFARLLVKYVHDISIHGGNQLVLRLIRIEYWIPRLTSLIRSTINRCKRCLLDRKKSCTQIMAALPPERTVLTRPFTTTGVDFAGPFEIKSFIGRACKITKGYVCVFVCFSTKAIHLEATSDLSTTTFLAAFHRFISRRGCPKTIFSDNGTNFVGASREMEKDLRCVFKEGRDKVCSAYQFQQLSWQFIPAGAPHMGGLWEAAVKSFKTHFRKHASGFKFTFEEFSTVLSRIEACLNSRPMHHNDCVAPKNKNK
ncbi:uncharacterized protein LOC142231072 [Haematobia irritans]|uniref:uncharacterized protein LOC142231072 n=1 Tax=Haematobia irritans TaxID=7368 RepID=UPI003F50642B